jgi:hypothetical protein
MSIAARAGQIAVCLILFLTMLAIGGAMIARAFRRTRITAAYVGSAFGPIEMESLPTLEPTAIRDLPTGDEIDEQLARYRLSHQP